MLPANMYDRAKFDARKAMIVVLIDVKVGCKLI